MRDLNELWTLTESGWELIAYWVDKLSWWQNVAAKGDPTCNTLEAISQIEVTIDQLLGAC